MEYSALTKVQGVLYVGNHSWISRGIKLGKLFQLKAKQKDKQSSPAQLSYPAVAKSCHQG